MRPSLFRSLAFAALALPCAANAELLCWSNDRDGKIECANPDGSERFDLAWGLGKSQGLAVDNAGLVVFWSEHDADHVMSSPLSVGAPKTLVAQLPVGSGLRGMAVAPSIGKVYWVAETAAKIQRANLDGTGLEDLAIPTGTFFDVEIDESAGKLYWTNGTQIWRGELDGTSASPIISGTSEPYYLALDLAGGKIYWTDFAANEIGRANLDGSDHEVPAPINGLLDRPLGIAFNPADQKVYWTLDGGDIQRANVDGTGLETILQNALGTWDVAIIPGLAGSGVIPASSEWGLAILGLIILVAGTLMTLPLDPRVPDRRMGSASA